MIVKKENKQSGKLIIRIIYGMILLVAIALIIVYPNKLKAREWYNENFTEDFEDSNYGMIQTNNLDTSLHANTIENDKKALFNQIDNKESSSLQIVPTKALFIGNSLLFGFGTHGMASSNTDTDYYYLVNQAITAKNKNYSAQKVQGFRFEEAVTDTAVSDWFTNTLDPFLAEDLDLVIIQLGDNINTVEKQAYFSERSGELLLDHIQERCPSALVVWVGTWYNYNANKDTIITICEKKGCSFISINDLNIPENQSAIGNKYIDAKGKKAEITVSGVASHPSDAGMKAIADRIIEQLGL